MSDPNGGTRASELVSHLAALDTSIVAVAPVDGVAGTFLGAPAILGATAWSGGDGFTLQAEMTADAAFRDLFPGMPPAADDIAKDLWGREPGRFDLGGAKLAKGARFLMIDPPPEATQASVQAALPTGWALPEDLAFPLSGPVLLLQGQIADDALSGLGVLAAVLAAAGKDLTVTGRADLWNALPPVLVLTRSLGSAGPLHGAVIRIEAPLLGFAEGPVVAVAATLGLGGDTLAIFAGLADGGTRLEARLAYSPSRDSTLFKPLADIGLLPSGLQMDASLSVSWDGAPKLDYASFELAMTSWPLVSGFIVLESCDVRIVSLDPLGRNILFVSVQAQARLGGSLTLDAEGTWPAGVFRLSLPHGASWKAANLAAPLHLEGVLDAGGLEHLSIGDFRLAYDPSVNAVDASVALTDPWEMGEFHLQNVVLSVSGPPGALAVSARAQASIGEDLLIVVELDHAAGSWKFAGDVRLAGRRFEIDATTGTPTTFAASWSADQGGPLALLDLAEGIGIDVSAIPAAIAPELMSLSLKYDGSQPSITLAGKTGKVQADFARAVQDGTALYAAQVGVDVSLGLDRLPLVGSMIGSALSLEGVQLAFASGGDLKNAPQAIKSLLPAKADPPPRAALDIKASIGGEERDILLSFGGVPEARPISGPKPAEAALASGAAPAAPSSNAPDPHWEPVSHTAGPLSVRRLGLAYANGDLALTFDASIQLAALSIDLIGLKLAAGLAAPHAFSASLEGLAISLSDPGVSLSGGLAKTEITSPSGAVSVEYDGQISLTAADYQLSALASYSTVDGAASVFAFAFLDAALGGPPFFYVTGLAAALGVNRDLVLPPVDQLAQFPLIAPFLPNAPAGGLGSGSTPADAVSALSKAVPPLDGEIWIAAGVRFTSFRLINSFALASVRFGKAVEIDIFGVSRLSVPPEESNPIAVAQMALEASFKPDEGVLRVSAQLTPASFIFSRDCHLTGGYALYAWFRDQGQMSAGDFVATLGGYHPAFVPPPGYPAEPRLKALWQVDDHLQVSGDYYFALTPNAVMAGGGLDAVWQSGDLRAWFSAHADFLLSWKPFHYEAEIGLSIGASYKIDMWLTSFTVTVHLGVDLALHGPPFGGTVSLDLYVCTIRISFGPDDATPDWMRWSEFKSAFLPAIEDKDGEPWGSWCVGAISDGLTQDLGEKHPSGYRWVVDPERLALSSASVIPAKTVTGLGETLVVAQTAFGVGPCGVADHDFVSNHTANVTALDEKGLVNPDQSAVRGRLRTALTTNAAPAAAWSKDVVQQARDRGLGALNAPKRTIENVAAGMTLTPASRAVNQVGPLAIARLQLEPDGQGSAEWSGATTPPPASAPGGDPWPAALAALMAGAPAPGVADALRAASFAAPPPTDLIAFERDGRNVYRAAPRLTPLGSWAAAA